MCTCGMCLLRTLPVAWPGAAARRGTVARQGAKVQSGTVAEPDAAAAAAAQPDSPAVQGVVLHNTMFHFHAMCCCDLCV